MESQRFDDLLRALAVGRSRRAAVGAAVRGLLGVAALGWLSDEGEARKHKKKHKKHKHRSQPAPCARTCAGKTCGNDGCGGSCGTCAGDKTCQGGACACPSGEIECAPNVCVPADAECCTGLPCGQPGQMCVSGQCVTWQGTCPAGADTCVEPVGCNGNNGCACYQTFEGETRCGTGIPPLFGCEGCESNADCAALYPEIPGAFCVDKLDKPGCGCPGSCRQPCPD